MAANQTDPTRRAQMVLDHAKASVENLFKAFDTVRKSRGAGQGRPTDEEQDLLRSALVFAAAGLDSLLKELIRVAVPLLAKTDPVVQQELETFAQRQLRGDEDGLEGSGGTKFLARLLVSSSPYQRLLDDYVVYLTGSSLQSVDQLFKTSKALGISTQILQTKKDDFKKIFDARNKIIHELDINYQGGPGRNRNSRTRPILEGHAKLLIPKLNPRLRRGE